MIGVVVIEKPSVLVVNRGARVIVVRQSVSRVIQVGVRLAPPGNTGNSIVFDQVQTLTVSQKTQACANIGVGNPERNFITDYITARDA